MNRPPAFYVVSNLLILGANALQQRAPIDKWGKKEYNTVPEEYANTRMLNGMRNG